MITIKERKTIKQAPTATVGCTIGCAIGCVVGCALALFGSAEQRLGRRLGLADFADPKTVLPRSANPEALAAGSSRLALPAHEGDRLCIAATNDGQIAAASIVNEQGQFVNLALPEDYAAPLTVKCTDTDPRTCKMTVVPVIVAAVKTDEAMLSRPGPGGCDPLFFQPGYYDIGSSTWHDQCTRRQIVLTEEAALTYERSGVLTPEHCPLVSHGSMVWVR